MYTINDCGRIRYVVNGCVYNDLKEAIEARNALYHDNE